MVVVRPRLEVADVVRAHGDAYRAAHRTSGAEEKVLRHIAACRTAALGGHVDACNACGHEEISYNSCRDRHCPKCQGAERARWLEQRLERLLPVPYFHVVFTLPSELNSIALRNKALVYRLLFDAASRTLLQLGRDEKHLGAQLGITAVLHTWGQNLQLHPHLHCVVTGGGLSEDGTHWVKGRGKGRYLFPVKVLSKLFRGKFLALLQRAHDDGELDLGGSTEELKHPKAWHDLRAQLYRKDWVVYAKRPFGGPEQVLRYLGRYTHRVAISNHRLVSIDEGRVTFTVRDRNDAARTKRLTLDAVEFLRRFLLHVLPLGFVRIRHYGLCAGSNVETKLHAARQLLVPSAAEPKSPPEATVDDSEPSEAPMATTDELQHAKCPACDTGQMIRRASHPSRDGPPLEAAA